MVAGNWAYTYAPVAFLQMIKESHIALVYGLSVIFGLEVPRWKNVFVLMCVCISASLAVFHQTAFSLMGFLLQMLAGTVGSMQIVLTNYMMTRSGGAKVDPMTMVLCTAPPMLFVLMPVNVFFWQPNIPDLILTWWPYLVANTLLAFVLQVTTAVAIRVISATGHAMASVFKDLTIVFSAGWILGEQIELIQYAGLCGSVISMAVYSAMKLFPAYF